MTPAPGEERVPSQEAFDLIAACEAAHFGDDLCADCVDAILTRLREVEGERDGLQINVAAITEKVNRYDREKGQAEQRVREGQLERARLFGDMHLDLLKKAERRVAGLEAAIRSLLAELNSYTLAAVREGAGVTNAACLSRRIEAVRAALTPPAPARPSDPPAPAAPTDQP